MKRLNYVVIISMLIAVCGLLSGCKNVDKNSNVAGGITFTDALERKVTVKEPKKVAALMGSYADVWLLAGGELAAVTEDAYGERNLALGEDVVNLGKMNTPDVELLVEADIDFVLLSSRVTEHVELKDKLDNLGINYAYFEVETFDDYLSMLKICTDITGVKENYKTNGEDIKAGIDEIINSVPEGDNPTVLFLRAFSTGVKALGSDSMAGIMLKELGCVNIADSEKSILEDLNMEKIVEEDPDFVFVVTMGSSEEKALQAVNDLLVSSRAWNELTAIKEGRYYILPKDLFHLKPNARWKDSYDILAKLLYEE